MIAHCINWIVYPSAFFFLDIVLKGLAYKQFFYCTLIATITSIVRTSSWNHCIFLFTLLVLQSSFDATYSALITVIWIAILTLSYQLKRNFIDKPFFPYALLMICLGTKIIVLSLFFGIKPCNLVYTIGQFLGNLLVLSFSLKLISAVKASNRL